MTEIQHEYTQNDSPHRNTQTINIKDDTIFKGQNKNEHITLWIDTTNMKSLTLYNYVHNTCLNNFHGNCIIV